MGLRIKHKREGDITFTIAPISVLFYDPLAFKCSGITIVALVRSFNRKIFVK